MWLFILINCYLLLSFCKKKATSYNTNRRERKYYYYCYDYLLWKEKIFILITFWKWISRRKKKKKAKEYKSWIQIVHNLLQYKWIIVCNNFQFIMTTIQLPGWRQWLMIYFYSCLQLIIWQTIINYICSPKWERHELTFFSNHFWRDFLCKTLTQ